MFHTKILVHVLRCITKNSQWCRFDANPADNQNWLQSKARQGKQHMQNRDASISNVKTTITNTPNDAA